ncbi:MAG: hypothetical protein GTO63_19600 [Anaerolineae bacterium]|nr:hypothetical protein [Anaerolineae bacterium]NIN96986.1 hypothetical protein [Anaerolineae bacterium]NIQ79937.1 hypothetical protein [Anaerolineae bacterium]
MTQEWTNALNDDPLPWLLEKDARNPGASYFSLWDPLDKQGQATNPKLSAPSGRALLSQA